MASAVSDLAAYLAAYSPSLSLTVGTNFFRYGFQPSPDVQSTLVEYQGGEPEEGFGTDGLRWERPRLQFATRGIPGDHATPEAKATACWVALGKVQGEALSGTFYHHARPMQSPFHILTDSNGREWYGFNIDVYRDLGA
jgi:hypothetical protein